MARLKPLLEDRGTLKIGHDMKDAARLLLRHGIRVAPYDCTMLMSYVLDGGQYDHGIEELAGRAAGHHAEATEGAGRQRQEPDLLSPRSRPRRRATSPPSAPTRRCACTIISRRGSSPST